MNGYMCSLSVWLDMWSQPLTKEIHISTAQRYASAAFRDGLTTGAIRDIASLASWGKHMQNVERDFHRWLPHAYDSQLQLHETTIEIFDADLASIVMKTIPVLLASDLLNALWRKNDTKVWRNMVGCTPEKCSLFWAYAEQDWAKDHPVIQHLELIIFRLVFDLPSFPTYSQISNLRAPPI